MQTIKDLNKIWDAFPIHSPHTTVLLDDSFTKTAKQPWNHLVLPEYVAETRARDVAANSRLSGLSVASSSSSKKSKKAQTQTADSAALERQGHGQEDCALEEAPPVNAELDVFDETLLAVIGVLDAVKDESNVSYWFRAGVLARPHQAAESSDAFTTTESTLSNDLPSKLPPWYADPLLAKWWADKGREALQGLGISLEHGVKF